MDERLLRKTLFDAQTLLGSQEQATGIDAVTYEELLQKELERLTGPRNNRQPPRAKVARLGANLTAAMGSLREIAADSKAHVPNNVVKEE